MNHAQFWGGAAAPYEIQQSLRFDGSSSLTLASGNLASGGGNYTYAFWIKRAALNSKQDVVSWLNEYNITSYFRFEASNALTLDSIFGTSNDVTTTEVFRDPSAWYHICVNSAINSASAAVYVNGVQVINSTNAYHLGSALIPTITGGAGCYIAEFYGTNGYLAPSNFITTNDDGVVVPKSYNVGSGSDRFYLKFDPSATNGVGHDHSGNGNHFTATGFTTSGTGTDVMDDTPTTNWCVLNPLSTKSMTLSNGNLDVASTTTSNRICKASFVIKNNNANKWYWEVTNTTISNQGLSLGICSPDAVYSGGTLSSGKDFLYGNNGDMIIDGSGFSWGSTFTGNDVIGVALQFVTGNPTLQFYINGTGQGWLQINPGGQTEWVPCWTTFGGSSDATFNFGQRSFEYTPPSGHLALSTANRPTPSIADGTKHFNTVLWSGASASGTQAITGVGFEPSLVWAKRRTANSLNHRIYDQIRGVTNDLASNTTSAEAQAPSNTFASFDSDGFSVEGSRSLYTDGDNYVAWNWKANGSGSSNTSGSITSTVSANPTAGFSIVSATAPSSYVSFSFGHGLGIKPAMVIYKERTGTANWWVWHEGLPNANTGRAVNLNSTSGEINGTYWGTIDSSVVTSNATQTTLSAPFIAYCFANVDGHCRAGSYVGNGSSDGPFTWTGFSVSFLLIKNASSTGGWYMVDSARNPFNEVDDLLFANLSDSEYVNDANGIDLLSNGFKPRDTGSTFNTSGSTYIYLAMASHPFGGDGVSPATAR